MQSAMLRGSILALAAAITGCGSSETSAEPTDEPAGTGGTVVTADAEVADHAAGGKGGGTSDASPGKDQSTVGTGGSTGADAAVHFTGTKAKIMPLGDSITASTCWRARLAEKLAAGNFTFDFVGSQNGDPGCANSTYDKDSEGHGGYIVADQSDTTLSGWFAANPPDIVLMHFGTNDSWGGQRTTDQILGAFTLIVTDLRAVSPKVILLVAKIIPLDPNNDGSCAVCPQSVIDLNDLIPAWAKGLSTAASPIVVVDQWTGFDDVTDTRDGVHPNDSGSVKMANKWYAALSPIL
jgi:lysophospholipase L1-like esterase